MQLTKYSKNVCGQEKLLHESQLPQKIKSLKDKQQFALGHALVNGIFKILEHNVQKGRFATSQSSLCDLNCV